MDDTDTRPVRAAKHESVMHRLRRTIVAEGAAPGSRLPTCRELSEKLSVSAMTVQRALDRLAREGFIETRGTLGTFVVDRPPHLYRYGIIFSSDPGGGEQNYWPPAWNAFNQEALRVAMVDRRRRVVPYYNITGHTDVEEYQAMLRDVHACKLAGLICVSMAPSVMDALLAESPSLPLVVIDHLGIPGRVTGFDLHAMGLLERSLDYLRERRHKRVAVIELPNSPLLDPKQVIPMARSRGLTIEPYWLLGINHYTHQSATNVVHLLMSAPKRQRPDAVVVGNPFLVESCTAGLVAAGLRVPQDVEVIAGGNFPHLTRSHVPVKWIGSDIRELLRASIDLIDRQRRGEPVPSVMHSKNIFEDELPARDPLLQLVEK